MFEMKFNSQKLENYIKKLGGDFPAIAADALNHTANVARNEIKAQMPQVFDRPTPYIVNSVMVDPAKPEQTTPTAKVVFGGEKFKGTLPPSLFMWAEVYGGPRQNKGFEKRLKAMRILPADLFCVPGKGAQLDKYGNISVGQVNQILAWFNAFPETGYKANMTAKSIARLAKGNARTGKQGFEYFALQKQWGKLLPGIYQRFKFAHGSAVKPALLFVRRPNYRKRLPFYETAQRVFDQRFAQHVYKAIRNGKAIGQNG